jgi:hypothetical protein
MDGREKKTPLARVQAIARGGSSGHSRGLRNCGIRYMTASEINRKAASVLTEFARISVSAGCTKIQTTR